MMGPPSVGNYRKLFIRVRATWAVDLAEKPVNTVMKCDFSESLNWWNDWKLPYGKINWLHSGNDLIKRT